MHGSVSVTRAVELLADLGDQVERSTLSRYIQKHADALTPQKQGRETVVDFETLAHHRRENVRLTLPDAPGARKLEKASNRSDEAAGNLRAQRRLRELELAEREQILTIRSEVEEGAHTAVSSLRNAFALALNDTAETIAALTRTEARLIRPHLRAFEKKGLDAFVRIMADLGLTAQEPARVTHDGAPGPADPRR